MLITPVERMGLRALDDCARDLSRNSRPIVFSAEQEQSSPRLTLHDLIKEFGHIKVPLRESDDEFAEFFAPKKRSPVAPRKMMELRTYIDTLQRNDRSTARPPYAGNIDLVGDPSVAHKFDRLIAQCGFPEWRPEASQALYRLWIGGAGQRSTIHNDSYHNFNAQLIGTKRFILFDPCQHDAIYPEYCHRGMWASPIDPLAPDLSKYPNFAKAQGFGCTLTEGEVLYVPRFWWHYVEAMTTSVNINLWIVLAVKGDEWWHEQRVARPFISYKTLLERERSRFNYLPAELQERARKDFLEVEGELVRLMSETS
jgi:peptidyl-lysine (3S)-dioxygenase / protease